jgi:hypothetical protein
LDIQRNYVDVPATAPEPANGAKRLSGIVGRLVASKFVTTLAECRADGWKMPAKASASLGILASMRRIDHRWQRKQLGHIHDHH